MLHERLFWPKFVRQSGTGSYPSRYRAIPEVEPLDPMHPDPLLEHNSLAAAQVHRSPCIQNFLEQEAQRNDTESLESNM